MNDLRRQVGRARRRLLLVALTRAVTWGCLVTLLPALVAVLVPKVVAGGWGGSVWTVSWLGGAVLAGTLGGVIWTWWWGASRFAAAVELDRRFRLNERVSSVLALSADELGTEAGRALLADAERRLQQIEVGERFPLRPGWRPLVPAATLVLAVSLAVFLPDATRRTAAASSGDSARQVRQSIEQLKKRLAQQRRTKTARLADADALFSKFERAVDDLSAGQVDRKQALVKLNNLSRELADQREPFEKSKQVRRQLQELYQFPSGPGEKIGRALKQGDLEQAGRELERLAERLRGGELSAEARRELAEQLTRLREQLQDLLARKQELEQKRRTLQEQIDRLRQQGDRATAGRLQQQLDALQQQLNELNQKNPQLQSLEELAGQLGECSQALRAGQGPQAAEHLGQMAAAMKQLQSELGQLETLDVLMDEITAAKAAMHCEQCGGMGCEQCQAGVTGQPGDGLPGMGMDEGRGQGDRPEQQTATGSYRTRVGATPRPGEAVRVGDADGPNRAGVSRQSIQEEVAGAISADPDPVVTRGLPRREREQTREYFERLRKGD